MFNVDSINKYLPIKTQNSFCFNIMYTNLLTTHTESFIFCPFQYSRRATLPQCAYEQKDSIMLFPSVFVEIHYFTFKFRVSCRLSRRSISNFDAFLLHSINRIFQKCTNIFYLASAYLSTKSPTNLCTILSCSCSESL